MIDLYVYYKVRELDAAALAPRVRAMQAALAASQGVASQLKRRPASHDGIETWMEVYPGVPDAFPELLAQAAAQAGLDPLLAGPRRAEVFVDFTADLTPEPSPCA
jgi:predicted kinase